MKLGHQAEPRRRPVVEAAIAQGERTRGAARAAGGLALIRLAHGDAAPRASLAAQALGGLALLDAVARAAELAADTARARGARGAAQVAIAQIERWALLTPARWRPCSRALSLASILLLMSVGLAIVFGLMGVINMAHGELMALGAYATFVVQNVVRARAGPSGSTRTSSSRCPSRSSWRPWWAWCSSAA